MATYAELTDAGVTTRTAAELTGLPRSTATRRKTAPPVVEETVRRVPANRLSALERLEILAVLDAPRFVDLPPIQIWAMLLDGGLYLCSISTMYRVLAEHAQLVERRRIARHPTRVVPELVATGPGQVYSWDITKLAGPTKGVYFDAYVMIDIYSRYIVGAKVHPHESGLLAEQMMRADLRRARHPARCARRPWHLDDVEDRRPVPRRPGGHPLPLPTEGVE